MSKNVLIRLIAVGAGCAVLLAIYLFFSKTKSVEYAEEIPSLPVITAERGNVVTHKTYPAAVEGEMDIEIRPQIDGYLHTTCVDEGDYVTRGTTLFRIEDHQYREQYKEASANFTASEANLEKAAIELEKSKTLVAKNIISEVQLRTIGADHKAALAGMLQAQAAMENTRIRLEFTEIKAPADGLVGRLPFRKGSLVSVSNTVPLTTLSYVDQVRVYFSISEQDYVPFMEAYTRDTVTVSLLLANGETYPHKGVIDAVNGKFEKNTGSISIRATFPNPQHILRSGNTGTVSMEQEHNGILLVPQESTFRLQDKTLVYLIDKDNKVVPRIVTVEGKSNNRYIISEGLEAADRILSSGMNRVTEGMKINPIIN